MSIYLWSSEPSKIYVWSSEVSAVFVGTDKVRPSILEYDFTKSDYGWTSSSWVNRSSSGFYIRWSTAAWWIIVSPNEVYQWTPKKIKIDLNRSNTNNTWTGIWNNWINGNYWYFLPRNSSTIRLDWNYNWTITQNSVSLGIGDITWELDIDSSTTNWKVTHKITGNNNITDTGWVLKYIWNNHLFGIRLIYWNNTSWVWPYIKKVTIEY
jgi:hypothetical protein